MPTKVGTHDKLQAKSVPAIISRSCCEYRFRRALPWIPAYAGMTFVGSPQILQEGSPR
jgi:hypothetical protein